MKIFFFYLLISTLNTKDTHFIPEGPRCDRKLLRSFGFQGLSSPEKHELLMCPFIERSCCGGFDQ